MPNIVPAATQINQMLSVMQRMREMADPGPTGGEQFRMEQYWKAKQMAIQQRKREFSETKDLMSMMLQNYQKASDDPFLQGQIQQQMIALHGRVSAVDPGMGQFLEAFTRNTPGSKQAYQQTMWLNANPAPPITATWEDDPSARAHQEFAMADWRNKFGSLFGGVEAAKATLLPTPLTVPTAPEVAGQDTASKAFQTSQQINTGMTGAKEEALYAYRGKDGAVRLMTDNQLGLRGLAKDNGISYAQLVTDGGVYGTERVVNINGKERVVVPFKTIDQLIAPPAVGGKAQPVVTKDDLMMRREDAQLASTETPAQTRSFAAQRQLTKDLLAVQAQDEKNDLYRALQIAEYRNWTPQQVIDNIMKPRYQDIPGLQFIYLGEKDEPNIVNPWDWGGFYGDIIAEEARFAFFQGLQLVDKNGQPAPYFLRLTGDGESVLVDKTGRPVPNPKQILEQKGLRRP